MSIAPVAHAPAATPLKPAAAARLLPDLATVLLCAMAFVRPLFSAESLGSIMVDGALVAAGIAVLAHDLQTRRPWRPSLFLLVALLAWIAGELIASRAGLHPAGLEKTLTLWGRFAIAAVCAHRLSTQPGRRRLIVQALIASVLLLTVYGLEEQFLERPARIHQFVRESQTQPNPATGTADAGIDVGSLAMQERYFNPRISGAFYSANLMGTVYMLGLLLTLGWGWARTARGEVRARSFGNLFLLVIVCGMLYELIQTGSKGAELGLVCGLLVFAAALKFRTGSLTSAEPEGTKNTRPLPLCPRRAAVVIGTLLALMLVLPVVALAFPINHPLEVLADGRPAGNLKSALIRADYWQTGWKMWSDSPLGIGPDQTQQRFSQVRSPWAEETPIDLHHEFFEFLVEAGPLALLGALGVFGWILTRGWRLMRNEATADGATADDSTADGAAAGGPVNSNAIPPTVPAVPSPEHATKDTAPAPAATTPVQTPDATPFLPPAGIAAAAMAGAWLISLASGWTDMNLLLQPVRLFDPRAGGLLRTKLAFLSLLLGLMGALAVWMIRSQSATANAPAGPRRDDVGRYLRVPLIAALVALLVHSGFDFVLQNGAVLLLAGLLAGLITAPAETPHDLPPAAANPAADGNPPPHAFRLRLRAMAPALAVAACILFFGYLTLVKPMRIETARAEALHLHEQLQACRSLLPPAQADETTKERYRHELKTIGDALVAAQRDVLDWDPDNYASVLDLHGDLYLYRYLALASGLPEPTLLWLDGRPLAATAALEQLGEFYVELNPYDGARWFYAGRLYQTLGDNTDLSHIDKALDAFQHAAALDPQRPLLEIMVGDCWLSKGDRHAAAQAYARAWNAQWQTSIPAVQFYSVYFDPKNQDILPPAETGIDQTLVTHASMILHEIEKTTPDDHVALLRRYWLALRTVQLRAGPLAPPADPMHPTHQENLDQATRNLWTAREKQTLDSLLTLRPGSVDTQLLLMLQDLQSLPAGQLTDKQLEAKFAALSAATATSTVDRPLPGTIERIEELVVHPPQQRYSPETYYAEEMPGLTKPPAP